MASLNRPWWAALAVLLVATCLWPTGSVRAGDVSLESAVKANFLYKFAPFVAWPPPALADPVAPFRICVIGDDPFGATLDNAVRGQRIGMHRIAVRRAPAAAKGMGCHILFAGKSRVQSPTEMLGAVAGEPVLTVTDPSRGVSGGMIQFVMRSGRVRFTIDAPAASASGLNISSKLMELAVAPGQ
ncbi:MAG: hypothetical protein JWN66_1058 [Sphingomonas bacterium]|jgi:hypothetical protein|uniref:YfiR family protein n=1 Tax=Sphingomonas bacterium TaxID=1895847 RepID=UPI00262AC5E8|nr:YfiR family protein [Sphingomonas bacterium]MDB5703942.1 hypothetical protein [Sphingomonas bacterium]